MRRFLCWLGFHKLGMELEHSHLAAPFHIVIIKYRNCDCCKRKIVVGTKDLFYKGK